ncbi:MAG: fluoride efflux transporter FluC [Opitutales bacterium]
MLFLLTALGCALGGVVRYLCLLGLQRWLGEAFPWGTLGVNLLGSLLLGAILGSGLSPEANAPFSAPLHAFAAFGFCGGLTTFSTFSLQNLSLLSAGAKGKLVVNILGSVVLCLIAATAGYALMEGRLA